MLMFSIMGLCDCGCGKTTTIAKHTSRLWGHLKGQPHNFLRGHNTHPPFTAERFWNNVKKTPTCWIWTGYVSGKPAYGKMKFSGKREQAHRIAWTLKYGAIPNGSLALHKCDNPLCVRPDHLFLGTHRDNTRDAMHKGRLVHGTKQHLAKLNEAEVRKIRDIYRSSDYSVTTRQLASMFGVGKSTICRLLNRDTWDHVCP